MRKVLCPQCKNETVFAPENPFRPFCSERCRLIDLGEWASESYRVVVTKNPNEDDTSEEPQDLLQMPSSRRDSEDPS